MSTPLWPPALPQTLYASVSNITWPTNWSYERWSQMGNSDFKTLSESDLSNIREQLLTILGQERLSDLVQHLCEQAQEREKQKLVDTSHPIATPEVSPPNWLTHWQRYHRDQLWGFVAFRTTLYDNEAEWQQFRTELERLVNLTFDFDAQSGRLPADYDNARSLFQIHWIEDPTLIGATSSTLRARYESLKPTLPLGQAQPVFLCASPSSVSSTLAVPIAEQATHNSKFWRIGAPFILAVTENATSGLEAEEDGEPHSEDRYFKAAYRVAIESVAREYWFVVDSQIMDLHRVTIGIEGSDELGDSWSDSGELEEMWWAVTPSPRRMRRRRPWMYESTGNEGGDKGR